MIVRGLHVCATFAWMFQYGSCCTFANGCARAEGFETAAIAAVTFGAVEVNGYVTEFASIAIATAIDLTIDDNAATNAGADGIINEVAGVFASAKCEFTECAYVGVVVDDCGNAEFVLDDFWKRAVVPSCYVCGVNDALCFKVDGAAKADSAR